MKNNEITIFSLHNDKFMTRDFEEAMENTMCKYSLSQLNFMADIS